jgi:hypothetical protein
LIDLPPAVRETTAFNLNNCLAFHTKVEFGQSIKVHFAKTFQDRVMDSAIAEKFKRNPLMQNEFNFAEEGKIQWDKFLKADDKLLSHLADEKGTQQLLRLIKSIPDIKFRLTPEQELMISTP